MTPSRSRYDVAIVGGGHNGLTAAAYLARAGLSVVVMERLDHVGGAAVSAQAFPGFPTRLSRYSYLVSLLPQQIITELGLDIALASRSTSSYTPWSRGGIDGGLLVERPEGPATAASFRDLTGSDQEYDAWRKFYAEMESFAAVVAPTLTQPLPLADEIRDQIEAGLWADIVQRPIGEAIERRFSDDLVRGVVATDALIGTFASVHDPSLIQNRCFLYHLIGNGTGEWRVPIGGMGAVTDALTRAALDAGAEIVTSCPVVGTHSGGDAADVEYVGGRITATRVLANVAPSVAERLLGQEPTSTPVGSQIKVNLLLQRLPRLRSGADPRVAFAGTLHLGESLSELERAWSEAAQGVMPAQLPGEVYCHSLTDASILGDVPEGTHTLTYFGLHTPSTLFGHDLERERADALVRAVASLDAHLLDPIASMVARQPDGTPCIEAKLPTDIEADLAMPGGNIFHGDLSWPWLDEGASPDTPTDCWGVPVLAPAVWVCGSGARRGGAVSGLGGHNAAQALLETPI